MTQDQIKYMVGRFLGWKLPEQFNPDCGISFKATYNEHTAHPARREPTGTNLFDARQAESMVRYMVDAMPSGDSAWQPISTLPECDDLLWFARGDTFAGPREPQGDEADYWDWWCYAKPPTLP